MKYRIILLNNKYFPQYLEPTSTVDWEYYQTSEDGSSKFFVKFDKQSDAKAFLDEAILKDQSEMPKVVWESDPSFYRRSKL